MQEPKQGEKPRLNLAQDENEEEGDEYEVFPDIGENLMIQRAIMIPKKSKSRVTTMKIFGFRQNFFELGALQGERYVKLLLIVVVVRIWLPKRW